MNAFSSMAKRYSDWLNRRPFFSRFVTAGIIVASGDVLCQTIYENKKIIGPQETMVDWKRVSKSLLTGLFIINTNLYFWYMKGLPLIRNSSFLINRSDLVKTIVGTSIDQSLFCTSILSQFFFAIKYLETFDISTSLNNVQANLWPALKANWAVWPFITFANLKLVPVMYQTIVVNLAGMGWNLYLAKQNVDNRKIVEQMELKRGKEEDKKPKESLPIKGL